MWMSVRAGRKLGDVNINAHASGSRGKSGGADFLAGGVDDVGVRGLSRLRG